MQYPNFWPKSDAQKPKSLQSRITEQQKKDLFNRRVTTRALAKILGVHEKYLSYKFFSKVEIINKKPLIETRKLYKLEVAVQVLKGKHTIQQAADIAYVSYNTMQRCVDKAKKYAPELIAPYAALVLLQKQLSIKAARDARNIRKPAVGVPATYNAVPITPTAIPHLGESLNTDRTADRTADKLRLASDKASRLGEA